MCISRIALPSPGQEEHTLLQGVIDYHGFEGKNCCPCCSQPKDTCSWSARTCGSQGSPGFSGSGTGDQSQVLCTGVPGWQPAGVVSILKRNCGLAAGRRPTAVAAIQHPFNSLLRGCDLIRFPQRSTLCMNYSVSLFYSPRGADDAPALSGEAVTVVRE